MIKLKAIIVLPRKKRRKKDRKKTNRRTVCNKHAIYICKLVNVEGELRWEVIDQFYARNKFEKIRLKIKELSQQSNLILRKKNRSCTL